jgi:hypothetical protein
MPARLQAFAHNLPVDGTCHKKKYRGRLIAHPARDSRNRLCGR